MCPHIYLYIYNRICTRMKYSIARIAALTHQRFLEIQRTCATCMVHYTKVDLQSKLNAVEGF